MHFFLLCSTENRLLSDNRDNTVFLWLGFWRDPCKIVLAVFSKKIKSSSKVELGYVPKHQSEMYLRSLSPLHCSSVYADNQWSPIIFSILETQEDLRAKS